MHSPVEELFCREWHGSDTERSESWTTKMKGHCRDKEQNQHLTRLSMLAMKFGGGAAEDRPNITKHLSIVNSVKV